MKTIKLLSTIAMVAFTSLQINAQITQNGTNVGIGTTAHLIGLNNTKNNIRLDLNGGFESGFTGNTTALRYSSGSEYSTTNSSTSGLLGFNYNSSGSSSTIGFSSTNRVTTARATTSPSTNIGGQFRTSVIDVSGTKPYEMAGVYGDIRSTTWNGNSTNGGFSSAIVGFDKINGLDTFAGYFDGKGYFSNRVGIGTKPSSPFFKLEVKGTSHFDGAAIIEQNLVVSQKSFLNGKVAIGTNSTPVNVGGANTSTYNLFVEGGLLADEIRVRTGWADYVFSDNYNLKPLSEVEAYIKENKHLPNVPSAKTIEEQGAELGDIARIQQEKIEELTLYTIQQQKEIDTLKKLVNEILSSK